MKVIFDYNVPAHHIVDKAPDVFIRVEAEILNIGTNSEVVFLRNISSTGVTMLWALTTSEALYAEVQQHAALVAKNELQHLSISSNAIPLTDEDMTAIFGSTTGQMVQILEATRTPQPQNQN